MAQSKEKEILITGFGGQGIILTGDIIGKAAVLYENKHATMTQSYGPEARGGACSSQVIISDDEILYPYVEKPKVLICMSQEGFTKNAKLLDEGGLLILDNDLVQPSKLNPSWDVYYVPATRFAEEMGNKMMANIVMLGFLSAVSDVASPESLKKAVLSSVPSQTREQNAKAFDRGKEYGEALLKAKGKKSEG